MCFRCQTPPTTQINPDAPFLRYWGCCDECLPPAYSVPTAGSINIQVLFRFSMFSSCCKFNKSSIVLLRNGNYKPMQFSALILASGKLWPLAENLIQDSRIGGKNQMK